MIDLICCVKVTNKPLDAVTKANEMGANEPNKMCSLFIVHSKFFNITKDPFAATMFKAAQVLVLKQIMQSLDFHSVNVWGGTFAERTLSNFWMRQGERL